MQYTLYILCKNTHTKGGSRGNDVCERKKKKERKTENIERER